MANRVTGPSERPLLRRLARALPALLLLVCGGAQALTANPARLITLGPDSDRREGDYDHHQSLFVSIPKSVEGELYLRLFDPDTGDRYDEKIKEWDRTVTRFRLIGGNFDPSPDIPASLLTHKGGEKPRPGEKMIPDRLEGEKLIAEKEYERDQLLDGLWVNLAGFNPADGLDQGDRWLFRLDVDGIAGRTGNVFEATVSSDPRQNKLPEGVRLFSYMPTVNIPPMERMFGEARFFVPKGMPRITVHNFDLEKNTVQLQTPFRTREEMKSSVDGAWVADSIDLTPEEQGTTNAISLAASKQSINDATFFVTDGDGKPLPFDMPFMLRQQNRRPVVYLATTVLKDCRTVVFDGTGTVDPDNNELTYNWDFGIDQGSGNPISFTYPEPGQYIGKLVVRDDSGVVGNSAKAVVSVTLNRPPEARIQSTDREVPGVAVIFDGSGSGDADGRILQYQWDFGDGTRGEGVTATHVYRQPGLYKARLQVRDDSQSPCALASATADIWINSPPVIEAGENRRGAIGEALAFTPARVYDADSEAENLLWEFGDGTTGTGRETTHAYAAPGKYKVKVTVDDGSRTSNARASDGYEMVINDPPVPEAGPDHRVAAGDVVSFDAAKSRDSDGKIVYYRWEFGDGADAEGSTASHAYKAPGVYTVTLTTRDDSGTRNDTTQDSAKVVVNFPPLPNAGPDQHLTQSLVEFNGTASSDQDGRITRYEWEFGDGTRGEGPEPTHLYGNPGLYTVRLTVTDDSDSSSKSRSDEMQVRINAAPIADAGPPLRGAPGQEIRFDGGGSFDFDGQVAEYEWAFDDGSQGNGPNPTHSYTQPGRYHVRLKVHDDTGHPEAVDEDSVTMAINAAPIAVVEPPPVIAPGSELTLRATGSYDPDGTIAFYRWEFDDGYAPIGGPEATRRYPAPGIYYATLTVDDGFGVANSQARRRVAVRVNHPPAAVPGADIHTCDIALGFDGGASTDGDGDALRYTWDFGDGSRGEGVWVRHIYAKGGVYPVQLTVDDGHDLPNSRHTASLVATINQPPLADAGDDTTVCAGDLVTFNGARSVDPKGRFLKYHWAFGDDTEGDGINPTKVYRKGGVFPVDLTVEDDTGLTCARASDRMLLKVVESPIADAGPDIEVCANTEVKFDGSKSTDRDGLVNAFVWNFGDGGEGGGATPTHMYSEPGEYAATLTITGDQVGSCDNTDTDTVQVKVHSAPLAVLEGPAAGAVNQELTFDGSRSSGQGAEIALYSWEFGDGAGAEGERVSHRYAEPGRYFVELKISTSSETQCNTTSQRQVVVINEPPVAVIDTEEIGAVFQELLFDGSGSSDGDGAIGEYRWDFGDGEKAQGIKVRHRYREPGSYSVALEVVDDSGQENNRDLAQRELRINRPPEAVIEAPAVACPGQEVEFDASESKDEDGEIKGFRWRFGDGTGADGARTKHDFRTPGLYQVTLELEDDSGALNGVQLFRHPLQVTATPVALAQFRHMACPGEKVAFDAGRSYDPDGRIAEYRWNFGDGGNATGVTAEHAFESTGRYPVRLEADDGSGVACGVGKFSDSIIVNTAPRANAGGDREAPVGGAHDAVLFDAIKSEDADGDPLQFRWEMGDGTVREGMKVWHAYREPGDYLVTLQVTDSSQSNCATATDQIRVKARAR